MLKRFPSIYAVVLIFYFSDFNQAFVQNDTCQCGQRPLFQERIVNGRLASPDAYPWQAGIVDYTGYIMCGGSVITHKHILSAAHCFTMGGEMNDWKVLLGVVDFREPSGLLLDFDDLDIHPEYEMNKGVSWNDISVITVNGEIPFNGHIEPICLVESDPPTDFAGKTAYILGWGRVEFDGGYPDNLREGSVTVYSDWKCKNGAMRGYYVSRMMICTSSYPEDSCGGDSGGPLLVEVDSSYFMQIGIVSFGFRCAVPNSAGVYTRVSTYIEWIKSITKEAVTCAEPV